MYSLYGKKLDEGRNSRYYFRMGRAHRVLQVCELITINGANLFLLRFPCQSHCEVGGATLVRVATNFVQKQVELNSQPQIAGERQRKAGGRKKEGKV